MYLMNPSSCKLLLFVYSNSTDVKIVNETIQRMKVFLYTKLINSLNICVRDEVTMPICYPICVHCIT